MEKLEGLNAYLPDGQKVFIESVSNGFSHSQAVGGQWHKKDRGVPRWALTSSGPQEQSARSASSLWPSERPGCGRERPTFQDVRHVILHGSFARNQCVAISRLLAPLK